jgi:hypothetical protein
MFLLSTVYRKILFYRYSKKEKKLRNGLFLSFFVTELDGFEPSNAGVKVCQAML